MKVKLVAGFLVILTLGFTVSAPVAQTANFTLKLIVPSDVVYYNGIGETIRQDLSSLLINVDIVGSPRPVYLNDLSDFDYDLALYSHETVNDPLPPLWSMLSPNGTTGKNIYRTNDPQLINRAGITDSAKLFDLLNSYHISTNIEEKIKLAKQIQQEYNSNWLLDNPLISPANIFASWLQFEKFDPHEGLINSLFLGAKWNSNPQDRSDLGRTSSEIHISPLNYVGMRNPLFFKGKPSYDVLATHFSSAFLLDANNQLHPNLVVAFNKTVAPDGSSSWVLHLRDDAEWSDGEPLNSSDLKFTYDLASFEWVGASSHTDWKSLRSTQIHNATTLEVTFADDSVENQYTLASQYIIPEHILNQSIEIDGQQFHPYINLNPEDTTLWSNFDENPITAGPYLYNSILSEAGVVDVFSKNEKYYWSPSIDDTPQRIFNLTSGTPHPARYYSGIDDVEIDTVVYHVGGQQNIDSNTLFSSLESGRLDIVEFDIMDSVQADDLLASGNFQIDDVGADGGGLVILFNPENRHLQNIEVRQAIMQAIDREKIITLVGLAHLTQGTPVSQHYPEFYDDTVEISYDFESARNTFRRLGYSAVEDNTVNPDFEWPWERITLPTLPVFVGMLGIVIVYRFRRRR